MTLIDSSMENPPASKELSTRVTFARCHAGDFEDLLQIRITAMRESLDRLGRFCVERARRRLERSFYPAYTDFILLDGNRIGFHTFRPAPDGFHLEHFYIQPADQSKGVGSHVLRLLTARADEARMPIYLGALKESPANRFYERHGFVRTSENEWDIYYIRQPLSDPKTLTGNKGRGNNS
jgi:ribosomal protein S18 acetylase RimI-like enzyme